MFNFMLCGSFFMHIKTIQEKLNNFACFLGQKHAE
jgi:hypothetical protein